MNFDSPTPMDITAPARWSSTRFALATALASWLIYLAVAAIRCVVYGFPNPLWLMERHAVTALVAIAMCTALHHWLGRIERFPVGRRLAVALAVTVPAAVALSVLNYNVMYVFAPAAYVEALGLAAHRGFLIEVLHSSLENYFVFAGWAVLWTAVSHAVATQDLLRRSAAAEAAARAAELRALRLQLDPHFLFNALNTVSGLIVAGEPDDAERAIDALSRFLRATLDADATADVPLIDELHLQRLYLAIEQIRFGDRLTVVYDIPDRLMSFPVPALILQPLVENSIRHAVARTSRKVTVTIRARELEGGVQLAVEDDGPGPSERRDGGPGPGVGLANVAARLAARHSDNGRLEHRRTDQGTTLTIVELPDERR